MIRIGSPARRSASSTSKSTPATRFTVSITSSTEKPWPAAIERRGVAAALQIRQRVAIGADQIADVDVVADAGAVRSRIVGPENLHSRPKAQFRRRP